MGTKIRSLLGSYMLALKGEILILLLIKHIYGIPNPSHGNAWDPKKSDSYRTHEKRRNLDRRTDNKKTEVGVVIRSNMTF